MGKMTDNCTSTKEKIMVKTAFDGTQSRQQAFIQLIRRQYRTSSSDEETNNIDISKYSIDKTQ